MSAAVVTLCGAMPCHASWYIVQWMLVVPLRESCMKGRQTLLFLFIHSVLPSA